MSEQIEVDYRKRQKIESVVTVIGSSLSLVAVVVACCICFSTKMRIPIENTAILALASLFILVPLKTEPLNILQKVTAFYLVSVPINQLSSQYFQISFPWANFGVSYSTLVLSLCTIGYLVGRVNSTNTLRGVGRTNILSAWVLTLVIIIVHMVLLTLILNKFYGYGYERNLNVLGNLCLYFLLFILLWEKLDWPLFRQGIGLPLAVLYLAVAVMKG